MVLDELKNMSNQLVQAIRDYTQEKDFDSIELERAIDELLCRLPRDIVYVEWFDRSDIQNMADGVYDEPANDDLVSDCMRQLWQFNNSIMDNEIVYNIVSDTVRNHKGE